MQNPVKPGLYELLDKDNGNLLGICELDSLLQGTGDPNNRNLELKLTLNLKFTYLDQQQVKSRDNQFHACYLFLLIFTANLAQL